MSEDHSKPKQLVILSGKGGTGKTTVSSALIHLSSPSIKGVYVDADVDAANLVLIIGAKFTTINKFYGGKLAFIDPASCNNCGLCFDICHFNAISPPRSTHYTYEIQELLCEGCGACQYTCPQRAIHMEIQQVGEWMQSLSNFGCFYHAELFPAAENSGKLVAVIKQTAKQYAEDHHIPLLIIDGPPGIGCPVISACTNTDLAVLVAEPGASGIHDLERIIQTLEHFDIPSLICINKYDLYKEGTREIHNLAKTKNIPVIGEIPFDQAVPEAIVNALPVTQFQPQCSASIAIRALWDEVKAVLFSE
jgi:MinD superfamily P-loop ATPase